MTAGNKSCLKGTKICKSSFAKIYLVDGTRKISMKFGAMDANKRYFVPSAGTELSVFSNYIPQS